MLMSTHTNAIVPYLPLSVCCMELNRAFTAFCIPRHSAIILSLCPYQSSTMVRFSSLQDVVGLLLVAPSPLVVLSMSLSESLYFMM